MTGALAPARNAPRAQHLVVMNAGIRTAAAQHLGAAWALAWPWPGNAEETCHLWLAQREEKNESTGSRFPTYRGIQSRSAAIAPQSRVSWALPAASPPLGTSIRRDL